MAGLRSGVVERRSLLASSRLFLGVALVACLAAADWSVIPRAEASRVSARGPVGRDRSRRESEPLELGTARGTDFEQWPQGEEDVPEFSEDMLDTADGWEEIYGLSRASGRQQANGSESGVPGLQKAGKSSWNILGWTGGIRRNLREGEGKAASSLEEATEGEKDGSEGGKAGSFSHRRGNSIGHRRWTGNVQRLLDKTVVEQKEKEKREQGSLGTEWLKTEIRREELTHIFLDYYKVVPRVTDPKAKLAYAKCKGTPCPDFAPCSERNFSEIEACHVPDLMDTDQPIPKPPVNCPFLGTKQVRGQEVGVINPSCTHPIDFVRHELLLNQVFVLHNVYMNARGQVFNATHNFGRNGCGSEAPFAYPAASTRVTVFATVVNLANWNAWAFYHGTVEMLPMFFLLAELMRRRRGVPVAHRVGQSVFLDTVGQHLLGLPVDSLNLHTIPNDELFFAKTVIQPFYQPCARPSRSLWLEFRKKFLVPRDGVPMFNLDWTLRKPAKEASVKDSIPGDWVVVLGKRYHTRGLAQSDDVEAYLRKIFTTERVVIFDGSLSILEAKELFNRARLYVAVHGAAMTNMIFMPFNGFIYEMRPRAYHNSCYHYLAEVCTQEYYLSFGDGHKDSHTSVNVTEVFGVLDLIKSRMDKQLTAALR